MQPFRGGPSVLGACCASCWCSPSSRGSARPARGRRRGRRPARARRLVAGRGDRRDRGDRPVAPRGAHRRPATAEGSWVGDGAGRFLARSYGVPPGRPPGGSARRPASPWTGPTACCSTGRARRWRGSCPRPPGRSPVPPIPPVRRRTWSAGRASPTAPLPPDLTPVGDLTGRWVPTEDVGAAPGLRRLRRGRHLDRLRRLHRHRRLVARGPRWGVPGHRMVGHDVRGLPRRRRRAAGRGGPPHRRDGSTLVLLDADGAPVGHFRRAPEVVRGIVSGTIAHSCPPHG